MTKSELTAKVNDLISAYSCNPELKAVAENYLKAQDKASADKLIKALEENVCSIDETIALAESDMGNITVMKNLNNIRQNYSKV